MRLPITALLAVLLLGCSTPSTLRIPLALGQARGQAEASLEKQKYCRDGSRKQSQSYVRCHIKGLEMGESWIVVDYDKEQEVVRVQRMERFPSHKAATKRWNELVAKRAEEFGEESPEAREAMAKLSEAPAGAVLWKVWRRDSEHLNAIYLVKPLADDDPNVVEVLRSGQTRDSE